MSRVPLYVGCAGWSLNRAVKPWFPDQGTHLERYASVFSAVEINSSFYRPHRRSTYQRWAACVPDTFRFSVKLPRTITHQHRLVAALPLLDAFLAEVSGLGDKLGVLLAQLPPTLAFDARQVAAFLHAFHTRHFGALCIEPRHRSWFDAAANDLLGKHGTGRVAADPALTEAASVPGGDTTLCYLRLHGSPHRYYSRYDTPRLRAFAAQLDHWMRTSAVTWCIFDNTAEGHAVPDALALLELVKESNLA